MSFRNIRVYGRNNPWCMTVLIGYEKDGFMLFDNNDIRLLKG